MEAPAGALTGTPHQAPALGRVLFATCLVGSGFTGFYSHMVEVVQPLVGASPKVAKADIYQRRAEAALIASNTQEGPERFRTLRRADN